MPGILSLIVWSLLLLVTLKYVFVLLRADFNGEGGTFALMSLAQIGCPTAAPSHPAVRHRRCCIFVRGRRAHTCSIGHLGRGRSESDRASVRAALRVHGSARCREGPRALSQERTYIYPASTSFYLSRRTLRPTARSQMSRWEEKLFISLADSADDATTYFQLPPGRVVGIGTQIVV